MGCSSVWHVIAVTSVIVTFILHLVMLLLISLPTLLFPFMPHPSLMLTYSYIILHHSLLLVYKSRVELNWISEVSKNKVCIPAHLKLLQPPTVWETLANYILVQVRVSRVYGFVAFVYQ